MLPRRQKEEETMNFYPTKEDVSKYAKQGYKCVPAALTENCEVSEEQIYRILRSVSSHVFILDSAEKNKHATPFSAMTPPWS